MVNRHMAATRPSGGLGLRRPSGYASVSVQAALGARNQCNRRILEVYTGDTLTNLVHLAGH